MNNEVKEIPLFNRYYKGLYLRQVDEDLYQLHGPDDAFKYMRIGYIDKEFSDINFIDPDGGPMLCVGGYVLENTITKIRAVKDEDGKYYYLLEIKKDDQK